MWTDALRAMFTPMQWAQGVVDSMTGRVISVNHVNLTLSVVTDYERKYIVTVDLSDDEKPAVACTCHRSRCDHAAAACARLVFLEQQSRSDPVGQKIQREKREQEKSRGREKVQLLPPPEKKQRSTDYRSVAGLFDLRRACQGGQITRAEAGQALKLAEQIRIESLRQRNSYMGQTLLCQLLMPRTDGRGQTRVTIELYPDQLRELSCSEHGLIFYGQSRKALCTHVQAGLIFLDSYLQRNPVGDATDADGMALLTMLQQGELRPDQAPESPESGETLTLEPLLDWSSENPVPSLTFRLGARRRYVLRNLQTLMETVDAGGQLELGKEGCFDFSRDRFDEESQGWMDMIRDGVSAATQVRNSLQRRAHWEIPKAEVGRIELLGGRLDSFFGRCQSGAEIAGTGKRVYRYQEGRPPIRLTCEAVFNGREPVGVRLSGSLGLWRRGVGRVYNLAGDTITAVAPENCRVLTALSSQSVAGEYSALFGLRMMNEFLRHVLPQLERECEVERAGLDRLDAFVPPEAAFTFYLDADDQGLTCRADVRYGEDTAPLDNDCSGFAFADDLAERRALEAVRASFPTYDEKARLHRAGSDEDTVYALLTGGADRLRALGEVLSSERFSRTRVRRNWHINVGVRLESGLMRLKLTSDELSQEEIAELLSRYTPKKKFHRLRSGNLVSLEENGESLRQLMEAMHLSAAELRKGDLRVPAYRALYLDRVLEEAGGVYAERDRAFRKLIASFKTVSDSDLEVPASLEGVLRPYQKTGYRWLMTLALSGFGGILADDMGLGKTVQVIAMILSRKESGLAGGPSLVVCPASLVYNWLAEINKFAPQLRALPLTGTAAQRREALRQAEADVLITSYGTALRDAAEYADGHFDCLILDEAQAIKTHTAAQSKAVRLIPADHRFALTGTPIENRLSELWSIFDCLMPGFLYEYAVFKRELETPVAKEGDEQASRRLKRMVQPFILRRLKGDVLKDLPDKLEETRLIEMEPEQRKLYDARAQQLARMLAASDDASYNTSKIQVLAELTRLRQICCDPSLVYEEYKTLSAKREALRDMLTTLREGGHKTLVFSQFPSLLSLVEADLKADGVPYMLLTGATSKQERLALVDRFNRDDTPVFLISLKAGGTGLNLTGADTVIHFDPWWNLAAQNQATDRAHRIGQDKVVTVFKLIARGTIEERIVELQEKKKDLADAILSGEMGGFASMSREELLEIVGGRG